MSRPMLTGVAAMAAIVILSNILVQFLVGDWLTWGAFTYPFAFLVTDLMNRLYGPAAARRVVLAGFVVGLLCSFVGSQIEGPFGPLVSLRVAIGSATAFLVGQLLDVAVFNRLQARQLVAGAVRLERRGQRGRHRIFFPLAFAAGLAFIAPRGGRRLGERAGAAARRRAGGAALGQPRGCRFLGQAGDRGVRAGAVPGGARAAGAAARMRFGLAFWRGDAKIRLNRNQRKEVIQCRVRLWSVRPG